MTKRFICIHGHFYQPPRENPWTGEIGTEESAAPFHDWNERILDECYKPNLDSPLLDAEGRQRASLNNYEHISFNFGPTLLAWMERKHPEVYRAVLEADRRSAGNRRGHGNAIAQVYNHVIMPLAPRRDKLTQVRWGKADFRARFGREPEGLWLAETAVDQETLEVLVSENVRFTILAPSQALRTRPIGAPEAFWSGVSEGTLDCARPYRWFSRERPGRHIDLFFYHGAVAQAVAFERLLDSGEKFAARLVSAFGPGEGPRLVHIATDGETYGHHHKFGNMALSFALESILGRRDLALTNYGEFLSLFPPTHEADVRPRTSWSCAHGVGRWKEDCGCNSGAHPDWNQKWRAPLRAALELLAGELDGFYVERMGRWSGDPWRARNAFIERLMGRTGGGSRLLSRILPWRRPPLAGEERLLLEMQRQRQFLFTSCAWFFDDISGIEPVQILKYAARAIDLARELGHPDPDSLESELLAGLRECPSNVKDFGDGARVYNALVAPLRPKSPMSAAAGTKL